MSKISFKIGNKLVREGGDVFIIAEAGVNHNGRLDWALKLVDIAADCGADAVKFQTFRAEQVAVASAEMAAYQKKNLGHEKSQVEMLKELELSEDFYPPIIERCKKRDIIFLSTPHGGRDSVDLLEKMKVVAYKIPSQDLTNFLLLDKVAKIGKPIILSTGMGTLQEVLDAVEFIRSRGNKKIIVLHATTNYPCPLNEVNLSAMLSLMNKLDIPVGYSDHTESNQVGVMAVTLGAVLYECHFTIDKKLSGPDHIASCSPDELKERIRFIKEVKNILGDPKKQPTPSELLGMKPLVRKSLVAKTDLAKGYVITEGDLEAKRPGTGVSPTKYQYFIGKSLIRSVKKDEQLTFKNVSK